MSNKTYGNRLKLVRIALDYTQEKMSEVLLGKENKATISAYENGRLEIADKAKVVLFTTLNVNKAWWETGEGEMFVPKSMSDKILDGQNNYNELDKSRPPTSQGLMSFVAGLISRINKPSAKDMREAASYQDIFDRLEAVANEWREKYESLQKEFEAYKQKHK